MSGLFADARFAARQLRKQPRFTLACVAVLAMGIGGAVSVFSVFYQVLLKPLPYPEPERLVFVHNQSPKTRTLSGGVSGFDAAEIAGRKDLFSDAGVFFWNDLTLTGHGSARHLNVVNASASLFDTLGVRPELGRTFLRAEDRRGAGRVAILSDGLWRGAFGGDPNAIGRDCYLNGVPYRVTGVMPPGFRFPSRETEMWIPLDVRDAEFTLEGGRMEKWLHLVARLKEGVSAERANAGLEALSSQLGGKLPAFYPVKEGWRFTARPVAEEQTERVRRWIYLALAAVFSVLLTACINVSGLLLIRGTARTQELAVRRAIGATRVRVARLILAEAAWLVGLGSAAGVVLALEGVRLLNRYGPLSEPVAVRGETFVFAIGLAGITALLAGLAPALRVAGVEVERALKSGATRTATSGGRLRSAIVAAQIAVAVALTFTAVELNRSFLNLTRVPEGFDPTRVWTGSVTLPSARYGAGDRSGDKPWDTRFFEPLLAKLRTIPGVEAASGNNAIPFGPSGVWEEGFRLARDPRPAQRPEAQFSLAFPGYFEAMRIPVLKGRVFTERDRGGSAKAVVIDEELARRYFHGVNPIGQSLRAGGEDTPSQIVGVVGSVYNSDLGGPRIPEIYFPEFQERTEETYLVLRMKGDADPSDVVRKAMAAIDPDVALFDADWMNHRVATSLRLRQFIASLLDGMAAMGLLLAIVGIYGALAQMVETRRREMGIRVALGAMGRQVMLLLLGRAGLVVAAGLAAGAIAAAIAGRMIESQLFGASLADPWTWAAVLGAMAAAAFGAAFLPAWRASRIDPAVTLRSE